MTLSQHILNRIASDPRLAYYFDPLTRSMEMLTEAFARENNLDLEKFRSEYYAKLKFERPLCRECRSEL
jgi:hypothetical protein